MFQHQRKRIRVMSDEGSDNEESADGKQAIKETLFDDDDDMGEDVSTTPARDRDTEDRNEFGDLDEEEESGECVHAFVCVCMHACVLHVLVILSCQDLSLLSSRMIKITCPRILSPHLF